MARSDTRVECERGGREVGNGAHELDVDEELRACRQRDDRTERHVACDERDGDSAVPLDRPVRGGARESGCDAVPCAGPIRGRELEPAAVAHKVDRGVARPGEAGELARHELRLRPAVGSEPARKLEQRISNVHDRPETRARRGRSGSVGELRRLLVHTALGTVAYIERPAAAAKTCASPAVHPFGEAPAVCRSEHFDCSYAEIEGFSSGRRRARGTQPGLVRGDGRALSPASVACAPVLPALPSPSPRRRGRVAADVPAGTPGTWTRREARGRDDVAPDDRAECVLDADRRAEPSRPDRVSGGSSCPRGVGRRRARARGDAGGERGDRSVARASASRPFLREWQQPRTARSLRCSGRARRLSRHSYSGARVARGSARRTEAAQARWSATPPVCSAGSGRCPASGFRSSLRA